MQKSSENSPGVRGGYTVLTAQSGTEDLQQATRGWAKLPAIQKKRALRKFVQKISIGQNGLDIYYFSNSVSVERSLGVLGMESQSVAKVLPFKVRGTRDYEVRHYFDPPENRKTRHL